MKFIASPDSMGFYGLFGGAFVPELLRPNIQELENAYRLQKNNKRFNKNLSSLLKDYVGRPTPLYFSK